MGAEGKDKELSIHLDQFKPIKQQYKAKNNSTYSTYNSKKVHPKNIIFTMPSVEIKQTSRKFLRKCY